MTDFLNYLGRSGGRGRPENKIIFRVYLSERFFISILLQRGSGGRSFPGKNFNFRMHFVKDFLFQYYCKGFWGWSPPEKI